MSGSPLLADLIEALRCLPGVGGKSAQRMAFHLLERERERGLSAKHPNGVVQVGYYILDHANPTTLSHLFLVALHTAEFDQRRAPCLGQRHPRGFVLSRLELDVIGQLLIELALSGALSHESTELPEVPQRPIYDSIGEPAGAHAKRRMRSTAST